MPILDALNWEVFPTPGNQRKTLSLSRFQDRMLISKQTQVQKLQSFPMEEEEPTPWVSLMLVIYKRKVNDKGMNTPPSKNDVRIRIDPRDLNM